MKSWRKLLFAVLPATFLFACDDTEIIIVDNAIDLANYEMVDLTHTLNDETVFWPTSPIGFEHEELAYGMTDAGYFYSAYTLKFPEHGGTHLDAPIHFAKDGVTADQIPLEDLIGPAVVIDVSEQAAADPDYRLTVGDVDAFEAEHGPIASGSIVLVRTGWSERWPDVKAYLGDDTPGDASKLSFPSFGEEAAAFLVNERGVRAVGIDTASIDYGKSKQYKVHQVVAAKNVPGFENLTNLGRLPATGAIVVALPAKIGGGSGGPLRAVALVPK